MSATHAQETGTRNLHEKFDASSSQFLAPKQLSDQSRCMVRVTCCGQFLWWNRAVFYSLSETCTRKTGTRLSDTRARFWYQTTCASFSNVCHRHKCLCALYFMILTL